MPEDTSSRYVDSILMNTPVVMVAKHRESSVQLAAPGPTCEEAGERVTEAPT